MSDNIPFDIQAEILKRLPIKSLIRFRSVSKHWKSLIDSSEFIANYNDSHSQPKRLLVSYRDRVGSELMCVSVDDDDTFPQRKFSVNVPTFFKLIKNLQILGSSRGLLCLYGYYDKVDESSPNPRSGVVVIWNPSIQKTVVIRVPDESVDTRSPYQTVVGFGVCPGSNDLKLVKINYIGNCREWESISCIPFQVEVFSLSSRAWRIPSRNLPRKSIQFQCSHIVIDGFIYWMAFNAGSIVDDFKSYQLIISFDLTSEEFREIYLPVYLPQEYMGNVSISQLWGSLAVIGFCPIRCDQNVYSGVWMMKRGVRNSFIKLFTVAVSDECLNRVLGFRENGEPILEMFKEVFSASLEVYEPLSKRIKDLGIDGEVDSFFLSSYMETLMLLDQLDGSIYFNM